LADSIGWKRAIIIDLEVIVNDPLILITNDDGINSAGLRAAAEALAPLGELLIVAPDRQWSAAGRSMPLFVTGEMREVTYTIANGGTGDTVRAYAVDASPALCVDHAMIELVDRRPALVVAGINFGENVSTEVTISGTIGAALEGASFGIPALAVSMEMAIENHLAGDETEDYAAARAYTQRFARRLLDRLLPSEVDVLSINIPTDATPETPWRLSRLSRRRYFEPVAPDRDGGEGHLGYRVMAEPAEAEVGTDVWCLHAARQVSITPLSLDLTSRVDFGVLDEHLHLS
jgi:5'-nucleotidase